MILNDEQLTRIEDWLAHQCCGYPTCDGDLPGETHDSKCPAFGRREPEELLFRNFLDTIADLKRRLITAHVRGLEEAMALAIEEGNTPESEGGNHIRHDACDNVVILIRGRIAELRASAQIEQNNETIEDGFGSVWSKRCPTCRKLRMQVVRPGEAQCSHCG